MINSKESSIEDFSGMLHSYISLLQRNLLQFISSLDIPAQLSICELAQNSESLNVDNLLMFFDKEKKYLLRSSKHFAWGGLYNFLNYTGEMSTYDLVRKPPELEHMQRKDALWVEILQEILKQFSQVLNTSALNLGKTYVEILHSVNKELSESQNSSYLKLLQLVDEHLIYDKNMPRSLDTEAFARFGLHTWLIVKLSTQVIDRVIRKLFYKEASSRTKVTLTQHMLLNTNLDTKLGDIFFKVLRKICAYELFEGGGHKRIYHYLQAFTTTESVQQHICSKYRLNELAMAELSLLAALEEFFRGDLKSALKLSYRGYFQALNHYKHPINPCSDWHEALVGNILSHDEANDYTYHIPRGKIEKHAKYYRHIILILNGRNEIIADVHHTPLCSEILNLDQCAKLVFGSTEVLRTLKESISDNNKLCDINIEPNIKKLLQFNCQLGDFRKAMEHLQKWHELLKASYPQYQTIPSYAAAYDALARYYSTRYLCAYQHRKVRALFCKALEIYNSNFGSSENYFRILCQLNAFEFNVETLSHLPSEYHPNLNSEEFIKRAGFNVIFVKSSELESYKKNMAKRIYNENETDTDLILCEKSTFNASDVNEGLYPYEIYTCYYDDYQKIFILHHEKSWTKAFNQNLNASANDSQTKEVYRHLLLSLKRDLSSEVEVQLSELCLHQDRLHLSDRVKFYFLFDEFTKPIMSKILNDQSPSLIEHRKLTRRAYKKFLRSSFYSEEIKSVIHGYLYNSNNQLRRQSHQQKREFSPRVDLAIRIVNYNQPSKKIFQTFLKVYCSTLLSRQDYKKPCATIGNIWNSAYKALVSILSPSLNNLPPNQINLEVIRNELIEISFHEDLLSLKNNVNILSLSYDGKAQLFNRYFNCSHSREEQLMMCIVIKSRIKLVMSQQKNDKNMSQNAVLELLHLCELTELASLNFKDSQQDSLMKSLLSTLEECRALLINMTFKMADYVTCRRILTKIKDVSSNQHHFQLISWDVALKMGDFQLANYISQNLSENINLKKKYSVSTLRYHIQQIWHDWYIGEVPMLLIERYELLSRKINSILDKSDSKQESSRWQDLIATIILLGMQLYRTAYSYAKMNNVSDQQAMQILYHKFHSLYSKAKNIFSDSRTSDLVRSHIHAAQQSLTAQDWKKAALMLKKAQHLISRFPIVLSSFSALCFRYQLIVTVMSLTQCLHENFDSILVESANYLVEVLLNLKFNIDSFQPEVVERYLLSHQTAIPLCHIVRQARFLTPDALKNILGISLHIDFAARLRIISYLRQYLQIHHELHYKAILGAAHPDTLLSGVHLYTFTAFVEKFTAGKLEMPISMPLLVNNIDNNAVQVSPIPILDADKPMPLESVSLARNSQNPFCMVDKTGFLKELFSTERNKICYFTRPKQFGKTSLFKTVYRFCDEQRQYTDDMSTTFENTYISNYPDIIEQHYGKYICLNLNFSSNIGATYESFLSSFSYMVTSLYEYFAKSAEVLDRSSRKQYQLALTSRDRNDENLVINAFAKLIDYLYEICKIKRKQLMILIDEFDSPIIASVNYGFEERAIAFFQKFLKACLYNSRKMASYKFALLTGILNIPELGLTPNNSAKVYSIHENAYSSYFGFSLGEVTQLIRARNIQSPKIFLQDCIDWLGYTFVGEQMLFNPYQMARILNEGHSVIEFSKQWYLGNSDTAIVNYLRTKQPCKWLDFILFKLLNNEVLSVNMSEYLCYTKIQIANEDWLLYLFIELGYLSFTRISANNSSDNKPQVYCFVPNQNASRLVKSVLYDYPQDLEQCDWVPRSELLKNPDFEISMLNAHFTLSKFDSLNHKDKLNLYLLSIAPQFANNILDTHLGDEKHKLRSSIISSANFVLALGLIQRKLMTGAILYSDEFIKLLNSFLKTLSNSFLCDFENFKSYSNVKNNYIFVRYVLWFVEVLSTINENYKLPADYFKLLLNCAHTSLYAKGDYKTAQKYYQLCREDPNCQLGQGLILVSLGNIAYLKGENLKAMQLLNSAIKEFHQSDTKKFNFEDHYYDFMQFKMRMHNIHIDHFEVISRLEDRVLQIQSKLKSLTSKSFFYQTLTSIYQEISLFRIKISLNLYDKRSIIKLYTWYNTIFINHDSAQICNSIYYECIFEIAYLEYSDCPLLISNKTFSLKELKDLYQNYVEYLGSSNPQVLSHPIRLLLEAHTRPDKCFEEYCSNLNSLLPYSNHTYYNAALILINYLASNQKFDEAIKICVFALEKLPLEVISDLTKLYHYLLHIALSELWKNKGELHSALAGFSKVQVLLDNYFSLTEFYNQLNSQLRQKVDNLKISLIDFDSSLQSPQNSKPAPRRISFTDDASILHGDNSLPKSLHSQKVHTLVQEYLVELQSVVSDSSWDHEGYSIVFWLGKLPDIIFLLRNILSAENFLTFSFDKKCELFKVCENTIQSRYSEIKSQYFGPLRTPKMVSFYEEWHSRSEELSNVLKFGNSQTKLDLK